MTTVKLRIHYSDGRTEDREFGRGRYRLGRDTGDVVLADPNTSALHAELEVEPPLARLTDAGSTNGTFDATGARLSATYLMRPGEPLRMGSTQLTLLANQPAKGGTQVMAQVPATGIAPGPTGYGPPPGAGAPPFGPPGASAPPYGPPPGASASPYGPPPGASAPPYGPPPGASASPYGPPPGASASPYGPPPGASASPYGPPPGASASPYGPPPAPNSPGGYGSPPPGASGGQGFALGLPGSNGPALAMDYALWPNRVIGYLIDYGLVLVCMGLMYGILTVVQLVLLSAAAADHGGAAGSAAGGFASGTCCMGLVLFPLATLAIGIWNRVYLVSKRGYSIGQGFSRLRVVDAAGQRLTFGTAFLRLLAQIVLSMLPFGLVLDMVWPLFDPRRQTLHDKAVNCFVINAPA